MPSDRADAARATMENQSCSHTARQLFAEVRLWAELRNRQLGGLKFVRQAAGSYFVDFVCHERLVIVEVDGGTHSTPKEIEADQHRDGELQKLGFRIFRLSNNNIYDHIDQALDALLAFVEQPEP